MTTDHIEISPQARALMLAASIYGRLAELTPDDQVSVLMSAALSVADPGTLSAAVDRVLQEHRS